jgi:hypothetical protein
MSPAEKSEEAAVAMKQPVPLSEGISFARAMGPVFALL